MTIEQPESKSTTTVVDETEPVAMDVDSTTKGDGKKTKTKKIKLTKKLNQHWGDGEKKDNVIYLGRLPNGFEEEEMKGFFEQFGTVKYVALGRSKRTGGSKGYAHIMFEDEEVAKIVAETMSGYFLMQKRLICNVLTPEQQHDGLFARNRIYFQLRDTYKEQKLKHNVEISDEVLKTRTKKLLKKEQIKKKKLAAMGIEYDYPGYESRVTQFKKIMDAKRDELEAKAKEEETKPKDDMEEPVVSEKSKVKDDQDNKISTSDEPAEEKQPKKKKKKNKKRSIEDIEDATKEDVEVKISKEKKKKSEKAPSPKADNEAEVEQKSETPSPSVKKSKKKKKKSKKKE